MYDKLNKSVFVTKGKKAKNVDGDYDESELEALRKICDAAGLSKKDLAKILDWVSDYWKMGANGRSIISLPMPGDENII